jgi:L-ascorbate metabolism protein UlaG (beta-lactamase superfamily)
MPTIRRLTHSCLLVTAEAGTVLVDPDVFTWTSGVVDLDSIGDVQSVLITHEHRDHMHPEFIKWLRDRGSDVTVHANARVQGLLAAEDIETTTADPVGVTSEDNLHGTLPNGQKPPNRAFTYGGITHTGDSFDLSACGDVLFLPLMVPWGAARTGVELVERLTPKQVIPAHDFYLSDSGRDFVYDIVGAAIAAAGVEFVPLGYGDSYTI